MQKTRAWLLVLAIICAPLAGHADDTPSKVAPEGPTWSAGAGFQFDGKADKKRESVSGITCPSVSVSPRVCLVAFDEGGEARFVIIERDRLVPQPERIVLLPGEQELDAEGAARDGDTIYITGSHSPKRNNCKENPNSRHLFRFKVDPGTGRAKVDETGKPVDLEDDRGNLWKYLTENKPFDKFVGPGKCLGKPDHAVNIEGLAAADGMLYFGFREPAQDQHTYILAVSAEQLFSATGISAAKQTEITVGSSRGIRDMLAVPEGITGDEGIDRSASIIPNRRRHPTSPNVVALSQPTNGTKIDDVAQLGEKLRPNIHDAFARVPEACDRGGSKGKRALRSKIGTLTAALALIRKIQTIDSQRMALNSETLPIAAEPQIVQFS